MASFKSKFPVLQELFAKNHRGGPLAPPSGARVNIELSCLVDYGRMLLLAKSYYAGVSTYLSLCGRYRRHWQRRALVINKRVDI